MNLLDKITAYFSGEGPLMHLADGREVTPMVQHAVAIVLLELAIGDEEFEESEKKEILKNLKRSFSLSNEEVKELFEDAEAFAGHELSIDPWFNLIKRLFDAEQRKEVVTIAWRVAKADSRVLAFEESFISHLSKALELSEEDIAQAKAKA